MIYRLLVAFLILGALPLLVVPPIDCGSTIIDPEDMVLRDAFAYAVDAWMPWIPARPPEIVRWCVYDCISSTAWGGWGNNPTSSVAAFTNSGRSIEIHATADWRNGNLRAILTHEYGHVLGAPDVASGAQIMSWDRNRDNRNIVRPTEQDFALLKPARK